MSEKCQKRHRVASSGAGRNITTVSFPQFFNRHILVVLVAPAHDLMSKIVALFVMVGFVACSTMLRSQSVDLPSVEYSSQTPFCALVVKAL
jgi:hypothetical protein